MTDLAISPTETPAETDRLSQAELAEVAQKWNMRLGDGAGTGQSGGRWYCRLEHTDTYEVYLIGWSGTARTQLHDHGGSSGLISVITGQLVETRMRHGGSVIRRAAGPGQKFSFARDIIHDVENVKGLESLSVHVYSPPLKQQTYYEADAQGVVPIETVDVTSPEPGVDLTGKI